MLVFRANRACLPRALLLCCWQTPPPSPSPKPPTTITGDGDHAATHATTTTARRKGKVVFVMGATGTGKSRLAIDLAARLGGEVINSDKMQVYSGLDVVTNKVTCDELAAVPHHLLGVVGDPDADFDAGDFCREATLAIDGVLSRGKLPIVAGGSNSFIEALVDGREFRSMYECFFVWVHVELEVLHGFVAERVDKMIEMGMVEELRGVFDPKADYTRGVRRSIGVPEMDGYFRAESAGAGEGDLARLMAAAVDEMKANTCKLTCCQLDKIRRLRDVRGWEIHRVDATEVFRRRGGEQGGAGDLWELVVAAPCTELVGRFKAFGVDDDTAAVRIADGGAALAAEAWWTPGAFARHVLRRDRRGKLSVWSC